MTRKKHIILSAIVSAVVVAIPFVCSESLTETHYTVRSEKLSSDIKLAFISDLHNTKYGSGMSELIRSVERFAPDAVILGGDFFDAQWAESNSLAFADEIRKHYPCFYSLGNHEFNLGEQDAVKTGMSKLGITVLDGKYSDITVKGSTIRIHGIDGSAYSKQLESCANAIAKGSFNLLINHYPEEFPSLSEYGFDLILSGHAHGGQWRLPPFINGLYAPGEGLFPKYAGGLYIENGSQMIVSRGLQRCIRDLVIPRIFNRPESVYITLKSK